MLRDEQSGALFFVAGSAEVQERIHETLTVIEQVSSVLAAHIGTYGWQGVGTKSSSVGQVIVEEWSWDSPIE